MVSTLLQHQADGEKVAQQTGYQQDSQLDFPTGSKALQADNDESDHQTDRQASQRSDDDADA